MFAVQVAAVQPICPSVVRVTFTGDDLDRFADNGFDQRIKFFLPLDTVPYDELLSLADSADWYGRWRAMPDEQRHPIRTYTARGVRQDAPRARRRHRPARRPRPRLPLGLGAAPGDDLVILGPNADATARTAASTSSPRPTPTACCSPATRPRCPPSRAILERLPADARGEALLEMPLSGDRLPLAAPAGVTVRWSAATAAPTASCWSPPCRPRARDCCPVRRPRPTSSSRTWTSTRACCGRCPSTRPVRPCASTPRSTPGSPARPRVIKTLRRHLVAECGVDRKAVAFMGYWRAGRSEAN